MAIRLHVGCGTIYLDGYINIDLHVQGYSYLATERPDLVLRNRTTVERYYKNDESQESLEHATRTDQVCVVDCYARMDSLPYNPNSVDEIRSVQMLEHIPMSMVLPVLRHWHEILKPGGVVHVDVPDLEETARQLMAQPDEPSKDWYYRLIFGSQKNAFAYHRNGFSPARLERYLQEAGFREIHHLSNTLHFYPAAIAEAIK